MINITIDEMAMLESLSGYGAEEIEKQIASDPDERTRDVKHYAQLLEAYRQGVYDTREVMAPLVETMKEITKQWEIDDA